jgi:uncharacterized protein DUF3108
MGSTRDLHQRCTRRLEDASKHRRRDALRLLGVRACACEGRRETHERDRERPAVLFHDRRNYTVRTSLLKRTVPAPIGRVAVVPILAGALTALPATAGPTPQKLSALRTPVKSSAPKKGLVMPNGEPFCGGIKLAARPGREPFATGEELAYEITVAGVYVGRMETKVGRPRSIEGHKALSFFGRARTNAFASTFKKFAGRYMTLVDPGRLTPIGMRVDSTYGDDPRWEKVHFSGDNQKVTGSFSYEGKEGVRSYELPEPLMDVLAMLYFARTRELPVGSESCQHVFGARWLWTMRARVRGPATVDTPAGKKEATMVTTMFQRSPHPDLNPHQRDQKFEMDVYFAKDATQVPLQFTIRISDVTAIGKLVRWSLKDTGEDGWVF